MLKAQCIKWAFLQLAFLASFALASQATAQTLPSFVVTLEPERLVNGSPCVFRVTAPTGTINRVTGTWMWRRLLFNFDAKARAWYAVAGVGPEAAQASYPLVVEATLASGEIVTSTYNVPVGQVKFPLSRLSVDPDFLDPNPQIRARIARERGLKNETFSRVSAQPLWEGPFRLPLQSVMTEAFGTRRTFNGKRRGSHHGVDYDANLGTPIAAMNSGKVVLARNLFFEGNCVVLDHGLGLLTLYLHLSAFKVQEGATVKRGQVLGLSGDTGRVTGPHLHAAVRWQGIYVDPVKLYGLALP
ncbi:MAG: M23 family metallopeptidase [Acidobacteria bacterium]|nr:M23 family metallopeptidase [Acidobacteriota bacterium]MBI3426490.1 M23 family metallopeptidase [Acidobacteriota bacterium]